MIAGPLVGQHPGPDPGAAAWPRSGSTTCAQWGLGRHRSVDDTPYGGGAGMIFRPEPVAAALAELRRPDSTVILLDPAGEVFAQARAADLAGAIAPHLRLPALRGRRRADPGAGRPRAVDRRLRPDRRRAARAGRDRRPDPAAAGRDRRRLDRRGVVRRRPARIPAVHPPGRRSTARPCRRSCRAATTARSAAGGCARRSRADPRTPAGPARRTGRSSPEDRPLLARDRGRAQLEPMATRRIAIRPGRALRVVLYCAVGRRSTTHPRCHPRAACCAKQHARNRQ